MKHTISVIFFLLSIFFGLEAQSVDKEMFYGNKWYSLNDSNAFYVYDKPIILRILNFNSYIDSINGDNIALRYLGYKNYTELNFYKSGRLVVTDHNVIRWTYSQRIGKWRWRFDKENQSLKLYFNRKLDSHFKIGDMHSDTTMWNDLKLDIILLQLNKINNN